MLNVQTANAFIAGQRLLQSINGENLIIAGQTVPCLPQDLISGNPLWEQGGTSNQINVTVSVLKEDLPNIPLTNTICTFRGLTLRLISLNDADTFWSLQLIQQRA